MAVAAMKHMALKFVKLDKFEGVDFRRWQKKMHLLLSSMSVVYLPTTHIPKDEKKLWDSLEDKYMAKDASSKKFLVSNFTNYKMTGSRPVMEQYNELLGILGRFTQHKMNMDEAIQVSCIIDKLPPFWKDFKHTLKHNKEELTFVELDNHLCIEESSRAQDSDKQRATMLNIVNDNIGSAFMSTSKLNDSILWHARLGYVHFKRMQDMSKDGLIPAFDMDTKNDLCDLHATPSLGNKKYFMTFIDDASRFCYVYLLHTKDEALDKFKVFTTEVELQQMFQIKRIRINWGVIRLSDPKMKTLGERDIECIFVGYAEHSKAFRFYVIEPNESLSINSIIESRDAIFDENRFSSVPRPSHRSLINRTEDIGSSVVPKKDDPKTFDEAIKSQDFAFWKKAINNEMDSIMGNNTWVLTYLPPSTDIAKISRKRSKPDKHGHGNGIECAKAGRMLSKSYTSRNALIGGIPKGNDTRTMKETHQGLVFCTKRLEKEAQWL
ncbi:zinc finger, CCHC-type containing protein [Tanacetum coccineum]